jgi:NitT/TauT family transport system permease protein
MVVADVAPPEATVHDREISGLDALDMAAGPRHPLGRAWAALWPKVAAVGIALAVWQLVAASGWRPRYVLPGPADVLPRLVAEVGDPVTWRAVSTTMRRAAAGFAVAVAIGAAIGLAVARARVLRTAVGSMITGLQTMPSIAWFPLALILFRRSEGAILFVVVLGAAPSVANGVIAGVDHVPPLLLRTGRVLGATGLRGYRHVVVPAAMPSFTAGLKQGWAFVWRSLMAGELLVIIANQPSIGSRLMFEREFADSAGLVCWMIIIFVIGVVVDACVFGTIDRRIREHRGLGAA